MSITQIFNNPWARKGGMTIVNGQKIKGHIEPKHEDHIHVATNNAKDMLSVINKAREYGLNSTENPSSLNDPDGKINIKVHTAGSKHGKVFKSNPKIGVAVDISGPQSTLESFIEDFLLVDSNFPGGSEPTRINTKVFKKYSDYGNSFNDNDSTIEDVELGDSGVMPVKGIKIMIEKLKKKNIKSEDIKKYTNQNLNPSDRNYVKISKKGKELLNNEDFRNKMNEVCKFLNIQPDWLIKVMMKESGINPSATNSIGCGGLVGFCPDKSRGNTKTLNGRTYLISDLLQSPLLQLDAIKDMFYNYRGKLNSYEDLYLFNFWPAALGKPGNYVIGNDSIPAELVSRQNPGIAKSVGKTPGTPITVDDFKVYANKNIA